MKQYKTLGFDFAVLDRGDSRVEGQDKYMALMDDLTKSDHPINLIDIIDYVPTEEERNDPNFLEYDSISQITKEGQRLIRNALASEAVKAGAKVISASGCIDGKGHSELYSDDHTTITDSETVFQEPLNEVQQWMLEHHLIIEVDDNGKPIFPKKSDEISTAGFFNVDPKHKDDFYDALPFVDYLSYIPFIGKIGADFIKSIITLTIETKFIEFTKEPSESFGDWLGGYVADTMIEKANVLTDDLGDGSNV